MMQFYHSNAKTNVHVRKQIQSNSHDSVKKLADKHSVSEQTVSKWKNRNFVQDAAGAADKHPLCLIENGKDFVCIDTKISLIAFG